MMIYRLTVFFRALQPPLRGDYVTMQGVNGLLYHVLRRFDSDRATWLHEHPNPKPYNVRLLFTDAGILAGLQYNILNTSVANLLHDSWKKMQLTHEELRLGRQVFTVGQVEGQQMTTFHALTEAPARNTMTLQFQSPTSFKQGPGDLPLPLPVNVFATPLRIWSALAPPELNFSKAWLDWCRLNVFVTAHNIETVSVQLTRGHTLTGFVGTVSFHAHKGSHQDKKIWHTLGQFAQYSGIGRKLAMGCGAVTLLDS